MMYIKAAVSRLMYAARDITNTVGCLGLIVSSIISKKVTLLHYTIHSLTPGCRWRRG